MSVRHNLIRRRLGSFLGGLAPVAPTRIRKHTTKYDRTRVYLQSRGETWVTVETIANTLALTMTRAHECVGGLFRQGQIERRFPSQRGRRRQPQEYRWKGTS